MAIPWTLERLLAYPPEKVGKLYKSARAALNNKNSTDSQKIEANFIIETVREHGLLREKEGALEWSDPIMEHIADICLSPESLVLAIAASEHGLPALAGMEHLIVDAVGENYGGQYTTNHAGRKLAEGLDSNGWINSGKQRPMPEGSVAKTATVFVRRK